MFLDRFTGKRLAALPDVFLPSRYSLLESFKFNGHTPLSVGDLLADDGSGIIRIHGMECQMLSINQLDGDQAESELSAEAINAIAEKIRLSQDGKISPMLPAEMAAQCELDELERGLVVALREGHLHAISDRPRQDLRYDEIVAPVARARRLATSALSHLASHSDCWQQRTLSGIQPRKILARFSEDDYAIYENRLYKRLLDRIDRHLTKRLARIRSLNSLLQKALEFQNSEKTHFRLRNDICEFWGESPQEEKNYVQLEEEGNDAIVELEKQLRAIRGLKQRGLYTLVPPASVVPAQVHRTNILNHDPHYRHLPPLWEKLRNDQDDRQLSPEERLARQHQLQLAYISYVGLVLKRALERYKLSNVNRQPTFQWAGRNFVLKKHSHDWTLVDKTSGDSLTFIPIAWFGTFIENDENLKSGRVVCWPGTTASIVSDQAIPVSPMDLYVIEKMGRLIDEWLLRQVLKNYRQELGPLPTPIKQLTDKWPEKFESVSPAHAKLLAPLDDQQTADIKAALRTSANSQVETAVCSAIEQVAALATICGHLARFKPNSQQTFYCQCDTCKTTWELKRVDKKRRFLMRPKGAKNISIEEGFTWSGRDWLDFELD